MELTENLQRVLETLKQSNSPLSAYALLNQLRTQGFSAPMQVYRALERLAEYGLVHRLESLNAYVTCTHSEGCQQGFKAFAICDNCGHVDEFTDADLRRCLGRWMKHSAFSLSRSTIELHGRCATCSAPGLEGG
ncbi:transcriptional repressor [Salmonella enterica]|nr:transcriptional repressor [Salmonella enterica]